MSPTRREFLALSAASAGALFVPTPGWARLATPLRREFTAIRRNVGFFSMRGGTIGYLVNAGGVAVVDSQFPEQAQACIDGLNERSNGRGVDVLLNTHHHGDHSAGNIAFRGVARRVVAHAQADAHMRNPPGGSPPEDQLFPDTTFTDEWSADVGDERIVARHYGRAHTSGDAVITFERANVAHMGDLMFRMRHPVVDGPAGATLRGWMGVLEAAAGAHDNDTIFIFGHAAADYPVTGSGADLLGFRDYLGGVLAFVEGQIEAGQGRDEILAMRDPLAGFEAYGPFGNPGARDPLTVAYDEIAGGSPSSAR